MEGFEEKGKGFSPQGVLEIETNNETKVAVKQPRQIDIFAEGRGMKEEKSTSKDREGEDESKKAVLEHSLSNPEELGINPHNTLSQTLEKQIQMEPLHTAEGHFRALDPVITVGEEIYILWWDFSLMKLQLMFLVTDELLYCFGFISEDFALKLEFTQK